jgi:hypothetical protein
MRKLVLTILALLALFSALRAYTEAVSTPSAGVRLQPGLVEVGDGASSVQLGFGIAEKTPGQTATWSLLPLRLVYRSGDRSISVGLNGLSFLLSGGVSVGTPVRIDSPRTGDVISIGGRVTVSSRVDGDVWVLGSTVELLPRAEVTGNVVALGGKVVAAAGATVRGSVNELPQIKIPFLGFLGTDFSVQVLAFGRQVLGYLLLGGALFLSCYFGTRRALAITQGLQASWKAALVTLALSLVLVPLFTLLMVVSVVGIFFLPVLVFFLALLGLNGFLMLCARLGGMLRRSSDGGGDALFLFTSGLLGLFIVKVPALVGIPLTLVRSAAAVTAGQILQLVSLGVVIAGMAYGMAASLAHMRTNAGR